MAGKNTEKPVAEKKKKQGALHFLRRIVVAVFSAGMTLLIVSQLILWAGFGWLHMQGGQQWMKARIEPLLADSGYKVDLSNIGISIGSRVHIADLAVSDGKGAFLDVRDVTLGLDIPKLIAHQLEISLSAAEMTLHRLPVVKEAPEAKTGGEFVWPEKYFAAASLDSLDIGKLVLMPEVAGARIELALKADARAQPAGTDVLLDLALEMKSGLAGLPEKLALTAVVSPATGSVAVSAINASSAMYDVSGKGKLGTDAAAAVDFALKAGGNFNLRDGHAKAEADVNITGTAQKPAFDMKGMIRLSGAAANEFDTISLTARMNAAGAGHVAARSVGAGKKAAMSADIAYGNSLLKLGGINIEWPGISARGSADIALDGGFRSASVALNKVTAGDLSFSDIKGRISRAIGGAYDVSMQAMSRGKRGLDVTGTVGIDTPGMPVKLTAKAANFEPFRYTEAIKGAFSGVLTVEGRARQYKITGTVKSSRLDITIPDRFNASIPKLNIVSGRGKPGEDGPDMMQDIGLDIQAIAERQVFVRGQGLDAEFGGKVQVTGTLAEPLYNGLFESRRGRYEAFGKRFDLSRARFRFEGPVPPSPYLDILAEAKAEDIVATIALTGSVSKPVVALSSVPVLPQDEVLSRLLFGKALSKLTPFQAIQIANALKQFSGGGGGLDPLSLLRRATGLDDLQVNTDASGATGVGAGKYITDKVYIEGVSGTDGKTGAAKVKIELTPNIKAESKVGPGQGSGAAIFWQKDY